MKELTVNDFRDLPVGTKLIATDRMKGYSTFASPGDILEFVSVSDDCVQAKNASGKTLGMYPFRFRVYNQTLTVKEQILLAQSYVGKTVVDINAKWDKMNITGWDLIPMGKDSSATVEEEAKIHGFCVAVKSTNYIVPVLSVMLSPTEIRVKLNAKYDAIVARDGITVGCQTFPVTILNDLKKALDSLN